MSEAMDQGMVNEPLAGGMQRRIVLDRYASIGFRIIGSSVLLSLLAIVAVLSLEILPLFHPVSVVRQTEILVEDVQHALFHDRGDAALVMKSNSVHAMTNRAVYEQALHDFTDSTQTLAVEGASELLVKDQDSLLLLVPSFKTEYVNKTSRVEVRNPQLVPITTLGTVDVRQVVAAKRDGSLYGFLTKQGAVSLVWFHRRKTLVAGEVVRERRVDIAIPQDDTITTLGLQQNGKKLVLGTSSGKLLLYSLENFNQPILLHSVYEHDVFRSPVTAVLFLLGDQKIIVGTERGGVTGWHLLPHDTGIELVPVFQHAAFNHAIVHLSKSLRKRTFLAVDSTGSAMLLYGTDGRVLWEGAFDPNHSKFLLSPRGDFITTLGEKAIHTYDVYNPYPEVSLKALFGEVWYEGTREPEYFWQSSGASDAVESKLSLIPLLYGSLKGTLYALIFSLPIALGGALYTSQFMHPTLKDTIKPILELMAAFPSVVIGFLAGLWLAPMVYPRLLGVMLIPFFVFILVVIAYNVQWILDKFGVSPLRKGLEFLFLIPVILVSIELSFLVANILQDHLFHGDFSLYLFRALGLSVDQRNSFIAGIAVGFVVIPVVFTIAEDCLSSVPGRLKAASLALGATQWETACRVVLPIALPGLFSAVMLGVGRAIGETMIVLMATGNTAIMELSPFNGFRALSATIAVELPEAPYGSALYRVLFVAAFLLFAMTFLLNIASEIIRRRLRKQIEGM